MTRQNNVGVAVEPARVHAQVEARRSSSRVLDLLAAALVIGQICALTAIIVVTIIQVIYRYVLESSPTWIQNFPELVQVLFAWLIFLGIPRAVWDERYAIRLGILGRYPSRLQEPIRSFGYGVTGSFFTVILWSYIRAAGTQFSTKFEVLPVPIGIETMPIAISSVASIIFLAWSLVSRSRSVATIGSACVGVALTVLLYTTAMPAAVTAPVVVAVLLAADAPVAVALGVAGSAIIMNGSMQNLSIVSTQIVAPAAQVALLAAPLFMTVGALFGSGTLAQGLATFVSRWLGWVRGGPGVATVLGSAIFANVTGSAAADTATVGEIFIPGMIEAGYSPEDAAATQSSAGVIGVIFPPAVAMILFSAAAQANVIEVFEAVIVPGALVALGLIGVNIARASRLRIPRVNFHVRGAVGAIPRAIPVLLLPLILDGGILGGVFTPSESGAVAIMVAVIFTSVFGSSKTKDLRGAFVRAMDNNTLVMFIITSVSLLNYGFVTSGLQDSVDSLLSVGHGSARGLITLLIINGIFIVVHEFIDAGPAIIVLVPLLMPAVVDAGISPLQLAAVIAVNSSIGAVLPPVGIPLYIASKIAGAAPARVFRRVLPFVMSSFAVLVITTVIPKVSEWLPGVLGS